MIFTKQVHLSALGFFSLIAVLTVVSIKHMPKAFAGTEFINGNHYITLDHPKSSEPEVKIFYTTFCRPCALVHSPIQMMTKRANAKFIDVPMNIGSFGRDIQECVIAAKNQGLEEKFTIALLAKIHMQQTKNPRTREDLALLLEQTGGNASDYRKRCSQLTEQAEQLDQIALEYDVKHTPTIVVNGNKQVNLQALNSFPELESLLNYLLEV
ncbi:disulfide bond formation protein DsbA [Vibrio sp. J383]|uniref:disulfide bond formation protein DsbA n=1 Tax=Vibrio sp. J383 TaxID=2942997 RepID=UPI0020C151BB|nr:disulfide bond formation protein DsbA [Vibrio sp. J383]UQV24246.1 disulfide bond formation protein DsbA [Vibrio sp. J383]